MSALSKWSGIVACGALAPFLLYSAWGHSGNGAYIRAMLCLVIAVLCATVVYAEIIAVLKARGVVE